MNKTNDMAHNAMLMKRCGKIYSRVTIIYAVICLFYAGITFFQILLGKTGNAFFTFLDGIFFKGILFFCGLMACYKNDNKYILYALVSEVICLFISDSNIFIFIISVILSAVTVYANRQYNFLKNQSGFPYFNERIEEQKLDRRQYEIKSEFQQNYERYKKQSSDNMPDIEVNQESKNI